MEFPGAFAVLGNATVNGFVCPTNLPIIGRKTCTVLTCAGTLSGNIGLWPLPPGYTGSITTNLATSPKEVNLRIDGPSGGTVVIIR